MRYFDPHSVAPLRILFIRASVQQGDEARQIASLARHLAPLLYQIDVISCAGDPQGLAGAAILAEAGVATDTPHVMDFERTVVYLADRIPRHDILVAAQAVANAHPALDRLHLRPPLINWSPSGDASLTRPRGHIRACVLPTEPTGDPVCQPPRVAGTAEAGSPGQLRAV